MFDQLEFWHWLIIGALLVGLELLLPGVFLLWLGIAAFLTGALMAIIPDLDWRIALVAFGALSVASIVVGMRFRAIRSPKTDQPTLNRRAEQYLGRQLTLDAPIVNGRGTVKLDDTTWRVAGPDLPAGTAIVVRGADGATLIVERRAGGE